MNFNKKIQNKISKHKKDLRENAIFKKFSFSDQTGLKFSSMIIFFIIRDKDFYKNPLYFAEKTKFKSIIQIN